MTTVAKSAEKCLVCGKSSDYPVIASTNLFGSRDLDTRPPQMMRSTIFAWIHRCPSCGYCAPNVSEGHAIAAQVVHSEAYLAQRSDKSYPVLANSFLCWALVQEAAGDYAEAIWAAIHAAWVCDDASAIVAADQCRQRAIDLIRRAQAQGISFAEGAGVEQGILADLLRRSGQFDQVEAVCEEGLAKNPEEIVRQVLVFQQALALREDRECHTVAEVVEPKPDRQPRAAPSTNAPTPASKPGPVARILTAMRRLVLRER